MRHPEIREALGRYLEGELAPVERRVVERHLSECATCREEHRELRATVDLLRSLPDPEPPASLVPDLLRRLESVPGPRRGGSVARWLRSVAQVPLPVPIAALAAGLAVLAVTSPPGGWLVSPETEAPRVAAPEASPVLERAQPPREAPGRAPEPLWRAPSALPPPISAGAIEPAALDGTRDPRAVRRRPRSSGIGGAAAQGEARAALPPRPSLVTCVSGAEPSAQAGAAAEECRPWLHGMVTLAQYDPRGFLAQVEELPETEVAAWLPELAFFSHEIRTSEAIASALRATPDPRALELLHWFEASPGEGPR